MPLRKKATGKRKQKTRKHKHKSYKKHRGGQTTSPAVSTFHFYNEFHYGDNILNLKFFYNISKILKEKNIRVYYYYSYDYIKNKEELERYVDPAVVILHDISEKPENTIQLWMGKDFGDITRHDFEKYYDLFYKDILVYLGLDKLSIDTSLYQKEDYLLNIYSQLNPKFHNLDILIINAEPKSGQWNNYDKTRMDAFCVKLSKQYKIATTNFINNDILCTYNETNNKNRLKIQDIGAISTHVKYIISIFSGPICACFNIATKMNVKKWFICTHEPYNINDKMALINTMDDLEQITFE